MPPHRRRFRIIRPSLQLRLILTFIGISAFALLLQYTLFARFAVELTTVQAASDGLPLEDIGARLMQIFLVSFVAMLPPTFVIGVLATHKFAGPIYRFEVYLKQVIAGEKPADCRLREGDELKDLCELINRATEPLRRATPTNTASGEAPVPPAPVPAEAARSERDLVA